MTGDHEEDREDLSFFMSRSFLMTEFEYNFACFAGKINKC